MPAQQPHAGPRWLKMFWCLDVTGAAPAAITGAATEYRASIEESAVRLHAPSADRRRSYDARASIDVRRVRNILADSVDNIYSQSSQNSTAQSPSTQQDLHGHRRICDMRS